MKLSERLAALRADNNLKLREVREQIQAATGEVMALSYLSSLEKEDRTPSLETLTKIASGYGMTLQELLAPVDLPKGSEPVYSDDFEAFAAERKLSPADKEELWQIQFRGARPQTNEQWDALYSLLRTFKG